MTASVLVILRVFPGFFAASTQHESTVRIKAPEGTRSDTKNRTVPRLTTKKSKCHEAEGHSEVAQHRFATWLTLSYHSENSSAILRCIFSLQSTRFDVYSVVDGNEDERSCWRQVVGEAKKKHPRWAPTRSPHGVISPAERVPSPTLTETKMKSVIKASVCNPFHVARASWMILLCFHIEARSSGQKNERIQDCKTACMPDASVTNCITTLLGLASSNGNRKGLNICAQRIHSRYRRTEQSASIMASDTPLLTAFGTDEVRTSNLCLVQSK